MYFQIAWKQIKHRILLLMLILTMALVFCQAVAFFAEQKLEQDAFRIPIVVENQDTKEEMESLLRMVLSNNEIQAQFDVERVFTEADGFAKLDGNEALAYIVFPDGFMESVMYGSNLSPLVYVTDTGFLEQRVLEVLVDTLEKTMQQTQSGIYTAMDIIRLEAGEDTDLVMDANWAYIRVLLNRNDMYVEETLDYVPDLSLQEHYILSFGIFFLFLTTTLFYPELNLQTHKKIVAHIKAVDFKYRLFYISQLLLLALLYGLLFAGMLFVLGGSFSIQLTLSIVVAALFFVLLQCAWFTKINHQIPVMQLNFVFYTICLFMAGGVIPTLWIPEIITKIAWFTPLVQMRELLSVGLVGGKTVLYSYGFVGLGILLLFGYLWKYMDTVDKE
ncbi:ABC transporter permease [Chakrabartyella piscis]|uniref:ABC transporter permease n=1 Tax=Chakrabartyella piscis TaxID=2918914 RepID=UPI00295856A8|nr:ABC transporter permease [Chakrabartyella piscis]